MRGFKIHPDDKNKTFDALMFALGAWLIFGVVYFDVPGLLARSFPVRPDSTQPIAQNGSIGCTGFSVNDKGHLFATAAHCVSDDGIDLPGLTLGGGPLVVVRKDLKNDLALVLSLHSAPAYVLGPKPGEGDELSVRGFVMHSPEALSFWGRVSNRNYAVKELGKTTMMLDIEGMHGLSGSPVLVGGQVVSVLQGVAKPGDVGRISFGATWEALRDFVGKDWR